MDIFERIQQNNAMMLEAYKDFRDSIDELRNEREWGQEGFGVSDPRTFAMQPLSPLEEEEVSEGEYPESDNSSTLLEEPEEGCEFPGRMSFDAFSMDPDDGSFYGGRETGIPIGLLVRGNDGQGKLLPLVDGLFRNITGEY